MKTLLTLFMKTYSDSLAAVVAVRKIAAVAAVRKAQLQYLISYTVMVTFDTLSM